MACVALLVKARRGADDPYVGALEGVGVRATFAAALDFDYVGGAALRNALRRADAWRAAVVTSKHAVVAMRLAEEAEEAEAEEGEHPKLLDPWRAKGAGGFFCVGPALSTGREAARLGLTPEPLANPGSAAELAEQLADALTGAQDARPLLVLAGNRRLPDLVRGLEARGVPHEEMVVYRTGDADPATLAARVRALPRPCFLGLFSPSGAGALAAAARDAMDEDERAAVTRATVAALGPTTAAAVPRGWHARAVVVAERPDAESLARAIAAAPCPYGHDRSE